MSDLYKQGPDLIKFGPKTTPGIKDCPACGEPVKVGDYSTFIALGPGDDEEARKKCREGKSYNAVATEVHWACATGQE